MKKRLIQASLISALVALSACDKAPPGMETLSSKQSAAPTEASIPEATTPPQLATTNTNTPPPPDKPADPVPTPPAPIAETPPAPVGETKAMEPEFPQPLFAGTPLPQNNPPPNLDKSGEPVTSLDLPVSTAVISKDKPVTSSDAAPFTGELKFITDGDKDGADGYFVELAPGVQWVQIDLEATKEIDAVWMWHFHKQGVIYQDVIVGVSDDPEFKNPTIIFNNDYDNTQQFGVGQQQSYVETNHGRAIKAPAGTKGRYVRLYSNGRYMDEMNHYIEVEVYGR